RAITVGIRTESAAHSVRIATVIVTAAS
ncbi:MAG: hypothetical protein QOF82_940, partial [Frankiales bacterium]|nr:hypothetical protein [Frankiales bacterium]